MHRAFFYLFFVDSMLLLAHPFSRFLLTPLSRSAAQVNLPLPAMHCFELMSIQESKGGCVALEAV